MSNILLESGTGELEVLNFKVQGNLYAINVIKVKEVLRIDEENIQSALQQHPAVEGMVNIRGEVITIIDLRTYLDNCSDEKLEYTILTEFNNQKILFVVDEVIGIEKLNWEDITKPTSLMGDLVNGIIRLDDQLISFLDFEKILTDIKPESAMTTPDTESTETEKEERGEVPLIVAEDSPTIRQMLKSTLQNAGYTELKVYEDGKQVLDYLLKLKEHNQPEEIFEYVRGVITDIEMPQMDGHTLIRKIKEDPVLEELPAVIFSSLITKDLRHKGEEVGADEQISKPEIDDLIDVLDNLVLN
ncbi:MAG: chemotaxis protein [Bacillota bacterium]